MVVLCSFAVACSAGGGLGGSSGAVDEGGGKDDGKGGGDGKDDGKGGGKGGGAGGGVGGGAGGGAGGGVGGGAGGGGGGMLIEGRMTGGGWIDCGGIRVSHGFELHCDADDEPNNLEVNWEDPETDDEYSFHLTDLVSAECYPTGDNREENPVAGFDTYEGVGTGRVNAAGQDDPEGECTATFILTDFGEPGSPSSGEADLFGIEIDCPDPDFDTILSCLPETGYPLEGGNHQAHPDNP